MAWILRLQLDTGSLDKASALLWDAGTTGIAHLEAHLDGHPTGPTLLAGFETEREASAAVETVGQSVTLHTAGVEPVDESTWADPDRRTVASVAGHDIVLAPGAAFGDGGHPTTRLALDLLATVVALAPNALPPNTGGAVPGLDRVVDFGSGTGILALAALAHGAGQVVAVENDPGAIDALQITLDLNPALTEGRSVQLTTALTTAAFDPAEGAGGADLVLANVLLPVHQAWGSMLGQHRGDNGIIVATGVLVEQEQALLACYPGLVPQHRRLDGDWLGLVLG